MKRVLLILVSLRAFSAANADEPEPRPVVVVGSKKFTESLVLAEMAVQVARLAGVDAQRRDLGGTPAVWLALTQGDIDVYPEYTGTITEQILKTTPADLESALAVHGIRMSQPLGFRNNYALAMRKDTAAANGIRTISDLRGHPDLRCGFIPEFHDRPDGWPGLKRHYSLPQSDVSQMAHTLAYAALREKAIDVMEVYLTDGEIAQYDLQVLEDDQHFFPAYEAVWLYRADLEQRLPEVVKKLRRLEGRITEEDMRRLNTRVQRDKEDEAHVAAEFVNSRIGAGVSARGESRLGRVGKTTLEHLRLVIPSLLAAMLTAIPLGILAARHLWLGRIILLATGILQTIPSLALLLFMIPVTKWLIGSGIGSAPAIAALFLYSLLPIVRNTHAGLLSISPQLRESAEALGLPRRAILWRIELPLAAPLILAGIKTAAVINVGTATLGGFIGAGGYGSPILRGIDKGDLALMLEGAIPAALMALSVELLFDLAEGMIGWRKSV